MFSGRLEPEGKARLRPVKAKPVTDRVPGDQQSTGASPASDQDGTVIGEVDSGRSRQRWAEGLSGQMTGRDSLVDRGSGWQNLNKYIQGR